MNIIAKLKELNSRYNFYLFDKSGKIALEQFSSSFYQIVNVNREDYVNKFVLINAYFDNKEINELAKRVCESIKIPHRGYDHQYYLTLTAYINNILSAKISKNRVVEKLFASNEHQDFNCLPVALARQIDGILEFIHSKYMDKELCEFFTVLLMHTIAQNWDNIQNIEQIALPVLNEIKPKEYRAIRENKNVNENFLKCVLLKNPQDTFNLYKNYLSKNYLLKDHKPHSIVYSLPQLWCNPNMNLLLNYIQDVNAPQTYKWIKNYNGQKLDWLLKERTMAKNEFIHLTQSIPSQYVIFKYKASYQIDLTDLLKHLADKHIEIDIDDTNGLADHCYVLVDKHRLSSLDNAEMITAIKKKMIPNPPNMLLKPYYIDIDKFIAENKDYKAEESSVTGVITVLKKYQEVFKLQMNNLHIKEDYREIDDETTSLLYNYTTTIKPKRLEEQKNHIIPEPLSEEEIEKRQKAIKSIL